MWVQFLHRHVLDTVVILEEGNFPHPRCARCDMLVPRRDLNGRHPAMEQCARGADRKRQRLVEAETRESSERAFEAYREPINNVSAFRYLVRVLAAGDNDWLAVVGNLGKARHIWGAVVLGSGPGGGRPEGVRKRLLGSSSGGATLWGGGVGPHLEDGEGPVQLSVQGREEAI